MGSHWFEAMIDSVETLASAVLPAIFQIPADMQGPLRM